MKRKPLACAIASLTLTACTTDVKHVAYHSTGNHVSTPADMKPVILGAFGDARPAEPHLLCVVRNAAGIVLKKVETDKPISDIVRESFSQALAERNIPQSTSANVEVTGKIQRLGCDYVLNKVFLADIQLTVTALPSRTVVYQHMYVNEHRDNGTGAGILADVNELTRVEEDTINQTIDKALSDPDFLAALTGMMPTGMNAAAPGAAAQIDDRLKKLDDLHAQGLISDTEYEAKRKEILESL